MYDFYATPEDVHLRMAELGQKGKELQKALRAMEKGSEEYAQCEKEISDVEQAIDMLASQLCFIKKS